ncbi:hypothetical protein QBC37DRAFT_433680 [Rhypophila decipiens]|uniref:NAD(P)-binding domain-containing protein n=1 Tax=Rhypophila decipiens TaxID=261697 RepID=A0AAN6Y0X2_9PEZI|nr:hypothetical protein QBC37DRAFT_433680 [Rhypophila decipiens]
MQITIIPASTRVATQTIRILLADPSALSVVGFYRNLTRVPAEFLSNPKFSAKRGDIEDASTLDFAGSDIILSITPMWYDGRDILTVAKEVSWNVRNRIEETCISVKRLVVLSSMGGQYDEGTGAILTNHAAEEILGATKNAKEVVIVRPAYFMENWGEAVGTIKSDGFFFSIFTPASFKIPHIAVKDIASTLAGELLSTSRTPSPLPEGSSPYALEIQGPKYSTEDVKRIFEEVSGKKDIQVREIPKEGVQGFYEAAGFPSNVAKPFAEMSNSILEGGKLFENPEPRTKDVRILRTELKDVIEELWNAATKE